MFVFLFGEGEFCWRIGLIVDVEGNFGCFIFKIFMFFEIRICFLIRE